MDNKTDKILALHKNIDNLGKITKEEFEQLFSLLNDSIATYKGLDSDIEVDDINLLSLWKVLLKLNIYGLFVCLDINTILSANIRSQSKIEKRSNLKYINVITYEGYRYMFGGKRDKSNAVWPKVSKLINEFSNKHNDPELITDLDIIKVKAESFKQVYVTQKDVDNRNLAIHYDMHPMKVCKYLFQIIDYDIENKRLKSFLSYIEAINSFVKKWTLKYNIPLGCVKANIDLNIKDRVTKLEDLNGRIYDVSGRALLSYGRIILSVMSQYNSFRNVLESMSKNMNKEVAFTIPEEQLESIYPGIHIAFIYIDIAAVSRAYLKSEHYIERILNLRRMNVIVYEGLKKLYGFNEVQKSNSFWRKHICSILDNIEDETLRTNINSIEDKLKIITQDPVINNFKLREYSVHYRYEGDDNLISLYHELLKFNMFSELHKAKTMLNILPSIIEMTTKAMSHQNKEDNAKISQQHNDFISQFDGMIDILLNQPSCSADYKDQFINMKENFRKIICKFKI